MLANTVRRTWGMETHIRYVVTYYGSLMSVELRIANDMPRYHHCPLTSPFILTDFARQACQSQALSIISRREDRWGFQPNNSMAARLSATNTAGSPERRAAARCGTAILLYCSTISSNSRTE